METKFSAGLEGVVACQTKISHIDPIGGMLIFRGKNAEDLAQSKAYEEILYHLLFGEAEASSISLTAFKRRMKSAAKLSPAEIKLIIALRTGNPMADFRTSLSALAAKRKYSSWHHRDFDQTILSDGLPLVAIAPKLAEILLTGKPPVVKRSGIGFVEEYLWGVLGHEPDAKAVQALHLFMSMTIDHGLAASTFAARVAASTAPDLGSVFTAAAATFLGILHGGAAEKAPEMLDQIGKPELATAYVEAVLDSKELLFGFGHRIYTSRDPRAEKFKEASALIGGPRFELALAVEAAAHQAFTHRKNKTLPTNMDYWSGLLLESAGIPRSMFNVTFWVSREGGILSHTREQIAANRIYRPLSLYVGPEYQSQLAEV